MSQSDVKAQGETLPKLTFQKKVKQKIESQRLANHNDDKKILSCPFIKGHSAQSYSEAINTQNPEKIQIFSLSFQTNSPQIDQTLNKISLIKQFNKYKKYQSFEKYLRRHRKVINDTSLLVQKQKQTAPNDKILHNKISELMIGNKNENIEVKNKSEKIRVQLLNRYINKKKQKQKNNDSSNDSKINFSLLSSTQQQNSKKVIMNDLIKQQNNLQKFMIQKNKIRGAKCFRFYKKSEIIQESMNEQQKQSDQFGIHKLHLNNYESRKYATRANLIEYGLQRKRMKEINYPKKQNCYKFYIGPGNNAELIKEILKKRGNWVETSQYDTLFHLRWEQSTEKSLYQRLDFGRYKQIVNHTIFHEHISTKGGLVNTIRQYLQKSINNSKLKKQENLTWYNITPITFIFENNKNKLQQELKKFLFFFCGNHPSSQMTRKKDKQIIDLMKQILGERINVTINKQHRNFLPPLPNIYRSEENSYLWIFKPSDSNRGRGIKLFSTIQELVKIMKDNIEIGDFVIQKYIQRPLLVKMRKFDIRVWVLLTGQGQTYFFNEGYIRTSCEEYDLNNADKYVHLTNNAVQQNSLNYGRFEDGNQLSFSEFDRIMDKPQKYFYQTFLPQIEQLCALVIQAALKKKILGNSLHEQKHRTSPSKIQKQKDQMGQIFSSVKSTPSKNTFEIFGFDYMIDENEKIWLIEVNTNPCIETSSKYLQQIIPKMLDDAFKKVIDPIFKPINNIVDHQGYEGNQNLWKLLDKNEQQIFHFLINFQKNKDNFTEEGIQQQKQIDQQQEERQNKEQNRMQQNSI